MAPPCAAAAAGALAQSVATAADVRGSGAASASESGALKLAAHLRASTPAAHTELRSHHAQGATDDGMQSRSACPADRLRARGSQQQHVHLSASAPRAVGRSQATGLRSAARPAALMAEQRTRVRGQQRRQRVWWWRQRQSPHELITSCPSICTLRAFERCRLASPSAAPACCAAAAGWRLQRGVRGAASAGEGTISTVARAGFGRRAHRQGACRVGTRPPPSQRAVRRRMADAHLLNWLLGQRDVDAEALVRPAALRVPLLPPAAARLQA